MKVWILLPLFNEEHSIPPLFEKIRQAFSSRNEDWAIIAVEDGSTDQSLQVLEKYEESFPLHIIRHEMNRGLGETERDCFEAVAKLGEDDDIAVRLDCDDTHEPEYILSIIDKMKEGFDVVNTSRFQPGGGQAGVVGFRLWISILGNLIIRTFLSIKGVKDYSCGFRGYRVRVLKDAIKIYGNSFLQLRGLGFTSTLETIIKLKLMGCRFSEVPFVLHYDNKKSSSKMVASITSLGYIVLIIMYHWPFNGLRSVYKSMAAEYLESPDKAVENYRLEALQYTVTKIGR